MDGDYREIVGGGEVSEARREKGSCQAKSGWMHHASTWLSAFVRLPHLQARPRLLVVCAHMCRCLWHVKNLLWQPPYSNFHET